MGELRDFYSALTAGRKRAKDILYLRSKEQSKTLLAQGFEIIEYNSGLHWKIKKDDFSFDYWPTTTLWRVNWKSETHSGTSIEKLVKFTETNGQR